jgi:hypothetical protein
MFGENICDFLQHRLVLSSDPSGSYHFWYGLTHLTSEPIIFLKYVVTKLVCIRYPETRKCDGHENKELISQ